MKQYQDLLVRLRQSFLTLENGQPLVLDKYFKEVFDEIERACKIADSVTNALTPLKRHCKNCKKYTKRPEYKALNKIQKQVKCNPTNYSLDFELRVLNAFIKNNTCEKCRYAPHQVRRVN